MKTKHYLTIGLLSLFVFLIINIPAALVINSIKNQVPQVKVQNVSGTLWSGSAHQVIVQSQHILKDVNWSVCAANLLLAEACINIEAIYKNNPLKGQLSVDLNNSIQAKNLATTISANQLGQMVNLPIGEVSGDIELQLETLSWQPGDIPSVTGTVKWSEASITITETIQLGDITIVFSESDKYSVDTKVSSKNGQLSISGSASLTASADYNLNLTLTPKNTANRNLKNSLKLFAKPEPDGRFILKTNGNLKQLGIM